MEIRFGLIFCLLTFLPLSLACHSMNGISKKAILRTLEKTYESPRENKISSEEISEELIEADVSSGEDMQFTTERNSQTVQPMSTPLSNGIYTKKNTTKNLTGEQYVGFKFINTSSSSAPRFNSTKIHPKFLVLRLLHEPMSVNEPGMKTERTSQPYSTVLSMKPPVNDANNPRPALTTEQEENEKINGDWGGECGLTHWKKCYNITVVGNPTEVHPQYPNDRKKNRQTQMDCFDTMEAIDFPWLCLRNGWTVNRCHILCMSMCNRELLMTRKWEFYVLHEGPCKTK